MLYNFMCSAFLIWYSIVYSLHPWCSSPLHSPNSLDALTTLDVLNIIDIIYPLDALYPLDTLELLYALYPLSFRRFKFFRCSKSIY